MKTAKDVWESVTTTYARKGNEAQVFELTRFISRSQQGEKSILQYFTFLTNNWKRLDHLINYMHVCSTDADGY